ncbi:MAG TPA: helix-hairpin-helix domain-containing protein, partial [Bacillota bacterium]|nr:helix-hairpin-helix domain-containing protein [Bacillota bacterium]
MTEKKAEIKEIIFHNKENAYTIAYVESEEESFTALGILPGCKKGGTFILRGDFKIHPKYGEQFVFTQSREVLPSSAEGIEGFLASGILKGIGPKAAKAIASKFGEDTFRIIEEEAERLTEVPGIGKKRAGSIAEAFKTHKEFAEMTLYFQQFGISAEYAMKLYRVYGKDTIEAVKENPYRLTEDVFGIGFKKADLIAEKMGVDKDDEFRIKSGIKFVLMHFASSGSTFVPQKELCEKAGELMDIESFLINDVLAAMAFEDEIRIEKIEDRNAVFLMPYFMAEQNVCKRLLNLEKVDLKPVSTQIGSLIAAAETDTGIHFSENQKYAIETSISNGVCVITGGPGTGKTTIINGIIKILIKSDMSVAVAAPTGRAAKRITETTGHEASTIHRLLEYYYSESEDAMFFGRNAE